MADKSFGIKQLKLIGASGTPTIESPINLNLNATTVAISTDVTIGGQVTSNIIVGTGKSVGIGTTNPTSKLTVKGNTSLETLNVSGVSTLTTTHFTGHVTLKGTFGNSSLYVLDDNAIHFGDHNDLIISHNSSNTVSRIRENNGGNLEISANPIELQHSYSTKLETLGVGVTVTGTTFTNQLSVSGVSTFIGRLQVGSATTNTNEFIITNAGDVGIGTTIPDHFDGFSILTLDGKDYQYLGDTLSGGGNIVLKSKGNKTLDIYSYTDNTIGGIGTATNIDLHYGLYIQQPSGTSVVSLTKSGNVGIGTTNPTSALTVVGSGTSTSQLFVTGVSTVGVVTGATYFGDASRIVSGRWTVGNNGANDYTFTGIGFTETTNDPILYLARGGVYEFVITSGVSHPFLIRVSNGGATYNNGITSNGATSGTIRFEVPFNAPNTLYYQCTAHAGMGNTISIYPNTI